MNIHEQQRRQRLLQFAAEGSPDQRQRAVKILVEDFGMEHVNIWKNIEQSYTRARTNEIQTTVERSDAAIARIESSLAEDGATRQRVEGTIQSLVERIETAVTKIPNPSDGAEALALEIKEWKQSWLFRVWQLFQGENQ